MLFRENFHHSMTGLAIAANSYIHFAFAVDTHAPGEIQLIPGIAEAITACHCKAITFAGLPFLRPGYSCQ